MQAYQSAPCPYCGITWNQPGAQACANCRNALPPSPPAYAPPGYAPPGYGPPPQSQPGGYPTAPGGYPGNQGAPYAGYPPAGYPQQNAAYPQAPQYSPYGQPTDAGYAPGLTAMPAGSSLQLFGRSVALHFALAPAVLHFQRAIIYGAVGVIVLAVALLGVTPGLAARQISAAQQALKAAGSHQPKIDAAFIKFFSPPPGLNDPNAEKTALQQEAKSASDALTLVQADESALKSADQQLSLLQFVAPTSSSAISGERHRLAGSLTGLKQADQALTAAVNESNVALPYLDAVVDYTKMGAALGKHDLVSAGALYPDAQQKIETAMSASHAAGLPPAIAKQVSSFNDALTATEALIQALQAKDAAAVKKANDSIQAALKAMSSPAETVPSDYESKTFGPMQKSYDSAIKALKN